MKNILFLKSKVDNRNLFDFHQGHEVVHYNFRDIAERKQAVLANQNEMKIKKRNELLKKKNREYLDLNLKYAVLNEELSRSLDHIEKYCDSLLQSQKLNCI